MIGGGVVTSLFNSAVLAAISTDNHTALAPTGPQAQHIFNDYKAFYTVCIIVYVLTVAIALIASRRHRQDTDGHKGEAHPPLPPPQLQLDPTREAKMTFWVNVCIAATVLILFGLLFVDFSTARAIHQFSSKPGAVNIVVTGHQWWWEVRYDDEHPQNVFTTANEIHVPTGRPVKIVLQAADVIHSFWVPNLTGKKDMIPNHSTELWFQADKPGIYWGQCAEFCGFEHAKMRLFVIADPPEVFDGWLNAARTPSRPPLEQIQKQGQQVFMLKQCSMCHTIGGTPAGGRVGPDLTHVMNRYTLAAGAIRNTPGQLAGWILDPQVIKPGCRMPQNNLSPHDLQALLEYLRTLQ